MNVQEIIRNQGWATVERSAWIAVQDHRPEFRQAFMTDRVGKIVDTCFYVTLTQLSEVTQELVSQLDRKPMAIKSTNSSRDATYWGFDTKGVADDTLSAFFGKLANAIDDVI